MNVKILTIAGILFALAFVIVLVYGFEQSKKSLGLAAEDMQSLYSTEAPIDMTLIDGRWVSGDTLEALRVHLDRTTGSMGFRPTIVGTYRTSNVADPTSYVAYRLGVNRNNNGGIVGITIEESKTLP